MMKNILATILLIVFLSGCVSKEPQNINSSIISNVEKIEVIHFHGTHQCSSCIAVGELAEETINTYFSYELTSSRIQFYHINAELPENIELVEKYGVNSASLWIGVYDENGFHPEQNINVWYKIGNKEEYMSYLKSVVEKRLAGDFS